MRRFIQDKGRTSAPQVWEVVAKGNSVTLTWGQLGGAMQKTTQVFEGVSIGKSNEKSPKEVAAEWAEKQVLLRTRKGYREVDPATNQFLGGEESASEIEWDVPHLPLNLRFFKPQNSLNAYCEKLLRAKKARLLRKRDGMMHVIYIGYDGGMVMYSSTMQPHHKDEDLNTPWLSRFPHLVEELGNMQLPGGTVLLGELCTTAAAGYKDEYGLPVDNYTYVSTITKSLTPLALEKQQENGLLGFCIWDLAFWEGECWLRTRKANDRYAHIGDLLNSPHRQHLTMPEMAYFTAEGINVQSFDTMEFTMAYESDDMVKEVLGAAKLLKWEGFVVVDGDVPYDDKSHSFHGKAERPKYVCKLKPKLEADFIARWDPDNGIGARGKGKKSVGVGSVFLYLWDAEKQEEVYICDTGGGLTDADVLRFADPRLYPMVWKVEFDSWTPKGALRFPVFLYERDDKTPEECLIDQRPAGEEEDA